MDNIPDTWFDELGKEWHTPRILGRLKFRIASHRALRAYIIRRDKICQWCGSTVDLVADHILARKNGGAHHPSNMQALCALCNSKKAGSIDAPYKRYN